MACSRSRAVKIALRLGPLRIRRAIAHPTHGAIGFNQHQRARAVTSLSRADGLRGGMISSTIALGVALGNMVAALGADGFWPLLASRMTAPIWPRMSEKSGLA